MFFKNLYLFNKLLIFITVPNLDSPITPTKITTDSSIDATIDQSTSISHTNDTGNQISFGKELCHLLLPQILLSILIFYLSFKFITKADSGTMDVHTANILHNQYWIIAGIVLVALVLAVLLVYLLKTKKAKYDVNPQTQRMNDSTTSPQ